LSKNRHYFDWAAAAPPRGTTDEFDETLLFGNPSSLYTEGRAARSTLEDSRRRCAAALGVNTDEIYFTSGATESNAIVLFSTLCRHTDGIPQAVLTSRAEHPSIIQNCVSLTRAGVPAYYIDVDRNGGTGQDSLEKALRGHPDITMLALMHVNNETGAVSNLRELVKTARQNKKTLHIHSDMSQALGKLPLSLHDFDIDSASFSAHKIGGPRGIGILYLRGPLRTLYKGGGQEHGIRPGTENTAGAFRFARVLETLTPSIRKNYTDAAKKMSYLINSLSAIDRCTILPECRTAETPDISEAKFSPYILLAAFEKIPGEVMVRALDDEGFAVSTGSACSGKAKNHETLKSMGISDDLASTSIRISIGWNTNTDDINALIETIHRILKQI
jgi:cysteine desulfurase